MRVLICGTRNWSAAMQRDVEAYIATLPSDAVVIHGACKGVDVQAGRAAIHRGLKVTWFQPAWRDFGRAAGPIRNARMLKEGRPDLVVAFVEGRTGPGTANMLSQAHAAGVPCDVRLIGQSGTAPPGAR